MASHKHFQVSILPIFGNAKPDYHASTSQFNLNDAESNMTELNNITVTPLEDGMVSLLIDGQPISEKYGMKFEASIVDDIQALDNGQKIKLFDQFVFSHTVLSPPMRILWF